jgi:tetratricopeptide (TPR) repeat protein
MRLIQGVRSAFQAGENPMIPDQTHQTHFKKASMLAILSIVIALAAGYKPAAADIAPPPAPSGSNLHPPVENTNVRMVYEQVVFQVAGVSLYPSGHANVTARFVMHNTGEYPETMQVRFPLNHGKYTLDFVFDMEEDTCGQSTFPSLYGFQVKVDGKELEPFITEEEITLPTDQFYYKLEDTLTDLCWAYFEVTFLPGEKTVVDLSYTVPGYITHELDSTVTYDYILGTGAGWKGTIGEAVIRARFPYPLNEYNVIGCRPEDCQIREREITWHDQGFDPAGEVSFHVIRPEKWHKAVREMEHLQENPDDGEAWGRLGKAYKEMLRAPRGFLPYPAIKKELAQRSEEAYQKAVELRPEDADWQYGYAELLCFKVSPLWAEQEPTEETWKACAAQVERVLERDPQHPGGVALKKELGLDNSGAGGDEKPASVSPTPLKTVPSGIAQELIPTSAPDDTSAPDMEVTSSPTVETAEPEASHTPTDGIPSTIASDPAQENPPDRLFPWYSYLGAGMLIMLVLAWAVRTGFFQKG